MDSNQFQFLQNALRKHTSNEHLTVYEKGAVGKHFSKDLTTVRYDTLKAIAKERYPAELEKVGDFRKKSFDSFANDKRMDNPIMVTEKTVFHLLVYDTVNENR